MSDESPGKVKASIGLFLALAAVAGVGFAYIEAITAYEKLVAGVYDFPPDMLTRLAAGRLKEASWPLVGGTVCAVVSLVLTGISGAGKRLTIPAYALAGISLATALYVWAMHGSGILSHLM